MVLKSILLNDIEETDPKTMANIFNDYFISIEENWQF